MVNMKDISRVNYYIEIFPGANIWVMSKNIIQAKIYWNRIKEYLNGLKIKPYFISDKTIDGLSSQQAIILLCGQWYFNSLSEDNIFKQHLSSSLITIPIGEVPTPKIFIKKY